MSVFVDCKYRYQAVKACPWASVIVRVEGGYRCFEFYSDYSVWKAQK